MYALEASTFVLMTCTISTWEEYCRRVVLKTRAHARVRRDWSSSDYPIDAHVGVQVKTWRAHTDPHACAIEFETHISNIFPRTQPRTPPQAIMMMSCNGSKLRPPASGYQHRGRMAAATLYHPPNVHRMRIHPARVATRPDTRALPRTRVKPRRMAPEACRGRRGRR